MRAMTLIALMFGCETGEVDFAQRDPDEGSEGDGQDDEGIAIAGTWIDSFGITNTITDESWGWQYPGYPDVNFAITQFDNDEGVAIIQDEAPNDMGEHLWGRFDWMWMDDVPYYCQTATGLSDEDAALSTPASNRANVGTGCNGTAWFEMIPI